jgi:hypothetical protein
MNKKVNKKLSCEFRDKEEDLLRCHVSHNVEKVRRARHKSISHKSFLAKVNRNTPTKHRKHLQTPSWRYFMD